jgi:hemerythrin-like domain-containing protein
VLDATEAVANAIESGADPNAQFLSDVVEFLRSYANRQHHGKEEDLLFPELEKRDMPRSGGPVGMMLMEHHFGRSHIARMAESATAYAGGDNAVAATWADASLDYVALLREHIAKENQILFVMAERLLSVDDQVRLSEEFEGVDKNKIGEGECERLLQLAEQLSGKSQVAV